MSSQPNSVRITWFMRRVALHAWTRAHTWTQVRCVKTTRWTAASVLQVSDVCVRVYGPFFDVLWRSFEALRLVFVCVWMQGPCSMIFPWGDASLSPNASANTTKSTTPARFTDRTQRSGMSKRPLLFFLWCYNLFVSCSGPIMVFILLT